MRLGRGALAAVLMGLAALWGSSWIPAPPGHTRLDLMDAGSGRPIVSQLLREGDEVVLTWTNSLFGLTVTEVLAAKGGVLALTQVTFADPRGGEPPLVKVADVDDLYHTGGPFKAMGLSRPVSRVVFRVGDIGDPRIRVGQRVVQLSREVGFGGAVLLVARRPSLYETTLGRIFR